MREDVFSLQTLRPGPSVPDCRAGIQAAKLGTTAPDPDCSPSGESRRSTWPRLLTVRSGPSRGGCRWTNSPRRLVVFAPQGRRAPPAIACGNAHDGQLLVLHKSCICNTLCVMNRSRVNRHGECRARGGRGMSGRRGAAVVANGVDLRNLGPVNNAIGNEWKADSYLSRCEKRLCPCHSRLPRWWTESRAMRGSSSPRGQGRAGRGLPSDFAAQRFNKERGLEDEKC